MFDACTIHTFVHPYIIHYYEQPTTLHLQTSWTLFSSQKQLLQKKPTFDPLCSSFLQGIKLDECDYSFHPISFPEEGPCRGAETQRINPQSFKMSSPSHSGIYLQVGYTYCAVVDQRDLAGVQKRTALMAVSFIQSFKIPLQFHVSFCNSCRVCCIFSILSALSLHMLATLLSFVFRGSN